MIILQSLFRTFIVSLFTDVVDVQQKAIGVLWLISFNTFPDLYKGMLKGLIGALGLQHKAVWINFVAQWLINLSLQWYFALHLQMGLTGMWIAKVIMETCVFLGFNALIYITDWQKISQESKER